MILHGCLQDALLDPHVWVPFDPLKSTQVAADTDQR